MNVPSPAPHSQQQQQQQRALGIAAADHLNVRATGSPASTSTLIERLAIDSVRSPLPSPSSPPPRPVTMVCATARLRPNSTPVSVADTHSTIDDLVSATCHYPDNANAVQQHLATFSSLSLIDGGGIGIGNTGIAPNRTTYWDNCYKQDVSLSDSSPEYGVSTMEQHVSPSFILRGGGGGGGGGTVRNNHQNLLARLSPRLSHLDNYLLLQHIDHLAKSSLSLDQGYHTLVPSGCGGGGGGAGDINNTGMLSSAPSTRLNGAAPPPPPAALLASTASKKKCHHHPHHGPLFFYQQQQQHLQQQATVTYNPFERLSDRLLGRIFQHLGSEELSRCARVCRRWDSVVWRSPTTSPSLWRSLTLTGERVSGDRAIRAVLRQLCGHGRTGACPSVERVQVRDGATLTDRGVTLLARRCPALSHVQVHGASALTNTAMVELVTRCTNLQHLDVTGCVQISCIGANVGPPDILRRLQLQYLDLTDCSALQDNGLRIIVRNCPQLAYLYLRRCVLITDAGFKYIPSFCSGLRELSVSDCVNITDFGLYELAKLGATLRYLSVAKCDQISDAGLKVVAKRCYKLRYVNARGCEAVSDDAITVLARCCTRLRALDIGKCDVSDAGLRALAESCPNLKKLSLRNCDLVTDRGVQCVSYYCRGLQQLNIQDCQISLEGYRAVKKYCKRCVIEHTNPGFF